MRHASAAQKKAVRAHLRCVKLRDGRRRNDFFRAAKAGGRKLLTGLSQLSRNSTWYHCECLGSSFRVISDTLKHIITNHCAEPFTAPAHAAMASAPKQRRGSKRSRSPETGSEEEEVEDEEEAESSSDFEADADQMRLRPKRSAAPPDLRRSGRSRKAVNHDEEEAYKEMEQSLLVYNHKGGAKRSHGDSDVDADEEGGAMHASGEWGDSMYDEDEEMADEAAHGDDSGDESGDCTDYLSAASRRLGPDDSAPPLVASHGGRQPILSPAEERAYLLQLHYAPSVLTKSDRKYLLTWPEVRAQKQLVRERLVCWRVPKNKQSARLVAARRLEHVRGLNGPLRGRPLFSCRCGTKQFKRLKETESLLRHILECKHTAEPDAAAASHSASSAMAAPAPISAPAPHRRCLF